MTTLKNFPLLNQLGQGDANDEFDCVPTSIAAALCYLCGSSYSGPQLKDSVYGASYVGATAASAYVAYCAQQGVVLASMPGTPAELVALIRTQLRRGHPVIATEQDPYANPALGWTHVICFYACDEPSGTLTAMDPFGAKTDTRSASAWAQTFQFGEVWALYRQGDSLMGGIPAGWQDDGKTLKPGGCAYAVVLGFRDYILKHDWNPENRPLENEQHLEQLELSNPTLGAGSRQRFRLTTLEWTPSRGVFEGWCGPELQALETQNKTQAAQLVQLAHLNQQLQQSIQAQSNALPQLSPAARQVLDAVLKALEEIR